MTIRITSTGDPSRPQKDEELLHETIRGAALAKIGPNDPCWCGSGKKYKKCHRSGDRLSGTPRPDRVQQPVSVRLAPPERRVLPGIVSPMRAVPPHIARPDYARTGKPQTNSSRLVKTVDEIRRMRTACHVARVVLERVLESVRVGITTDELDAICHEETIRHGAYPSPLNYHSYPKSLCTSVNEVICHGIPDSRPLEDGDTVNCDVTIYIDGMHGDCSETACVGSVAPEHRQLVDVTRECMMHAIDTVHDGSNLRDIGKVIQQHAQAHGFSVVRSFVGHGIGPVFHMDPHVPHYFDAKLDIVLHAGMTFTIEPMINIGTWRHSLWDDEWTAVTEDLQRSAQFEHTVLVTEKGADILTAAKSECAPMPQ